MIALDTIAIILIGHWVFDFYCQTDEQAKEKSTSNVWLSKHVLTYTLGLALMALMLFPMFPCVWGAAAWISLNAIAHFFTDYITSRASSLLWKEGNTHDFFVVIGADQLIHYLTLFGTLVYYTR